MYDAKRRGRDRACVAGDAEPAGSAGERTRPAGA